MVCTARVGLCCCVWACGPAHSQQSEPGAWHTFAQCTPTGDLAVLTGDALMPLRGVTVQQLTMYKVSAGGLTPIPFQVDRRDDQGRYIIGDSDTDHDAGAALRLNDELVLRSADAGIRLSDAALRTGHKTLVELGLNGAVGTQSGWVYAGVSANPATVEHSSNIDYDPTYDVVSSARYQIGFNSELPFLIDTFRWRARDGTSWSADLVDTMKIRHRGAFLRIIPFRRTQRDYESKLVAVRAGPLRVIRRTENRVRMLWRLKTPAVYIDYVVMPGGFVMDTVIDIPFNVGLFFSDMQTLTTVDWRDDNAVPRLTVHAPGRSHALAIEGRMSDQKHRFNNLQSDRFAVLSTAGVIGVELDIPDGVPITPWLYLRDALDEDDPPEEQKGQFGNVGFRTTGWERIDTQVQHIRFTVCVEAAQ